MRPIDDELRSAFSSRTDAVGLSPDFFRGVERRAKRMRRNRVAASVAGSALTVTALGLGGPLVASSLTSTSPEPSDVATSAPGPADRFALDPQAPWAYRGAPLDHLGAGTLETVRGEYAARKGVPLDDVALTPLHGQVGDPASEVRLFFVAKVGDAAWWGVARSSEGGPEFLVDVPLEPGTTALLAVLPLGSTSQLVVVAAEATTVEYCATGPASCASMGGDGIGRYPLAGDTGQDAYRVLSPDGRVVAEGPAPDGEPAQPEGAGTSAPVDLDRSPYALDPDAPWAYRGPVELTRHPDLAVQDGRLFAERGAGRDDASWSDSPLYGLEHPDGSSVLVVLHRRGDEAVVTTTSQHGDEEPRQSEQPVREGQLVVQSFLPLTDGTGLLVALAAPRTGAVGTDVPGAEQSVDAEGVGVWTLPLETEPGEVFLYSEGDGLLYHSEPARRS